MKFDRSLFVKTAETQVSEDGTLIVYVDEETLESTGRVLIKSKTSSGGALFYADGTPQQWTPISRRLPKLKERVLVYAEDDESWCIAISQIISPPSPKVYFLGFNGTQKIKAWMPLPKQYKAESEDKE